VYRRSHTSKYVDDDGKVVQRCDCHPCSGAHAAAPVVQRRSRHAAALTPVAVCSAAAPEFASAPSSAPPPADFTVKVVNGVPQVVARGPTDEASLQAAALTSNSLLAEGVKAQAKGKGAPGETHDVLLAAAVLPEPGRRHRKAGAE
jgi:hypothetical protein